MLQSREGQRVPNVTFRVRDNNEWKDVTTAELFHGKTVAVFSLPGPMVVANALGAQIPEMPITPWRVLRALGRHGE